MREGEGEHRSDFLVFVAFLANLFLATFGADAVLSVVDDALLLGPADPVVTAVRAVAGGFALLLAVVMLFVVIFVPHLPKIVLGPPLLVIFWQAFGAPPVAWSVSDPATWLPIDLVQLAAAVWAFVAARVMTGGWFLSASRLPHKNYLLLRTLIALPVAVVVAGFLVAGTLVGALVVYLQDETHGYVHFTWSGVEVRETVMRRDDKVVHLAATVHFADAHFYTELYRRIPADALVLAEGVTDKDGRLRRGLSYGGAAQTLGLQTQDVFEILLGPDIDEKRTADKEPGPGKGAPKAADNKVAAAPKSRPDVVHADMDVADFSPVTFRFIERIGEVYSSRDFQEVVRRLDAVGREFSDADVKAVMDDLIYKRNNQVLAELDERLPGYSTVYIPWGAQHMHDMELALRERGFRVVSQRMFPLARYSTIFEAIGRQLRQAALPRNTRPAEHFGAR